MRNHYSTTWFELFLEGIQPVQTEAEIAFITRNIPNPPYSTVLDLCCGQGRHAQRLADKNYQVTGVDLSLEALVRARSIAKGNVAYHQLDMRSLEELPGSFDAIVNLWQSFGYFSVSVNADILKQISQKLNRNGRLILDIYHREFFETHQGTRAINIQNMSVTETKQMSGSRLSIELNYAGKEMDRFDWQLYTPDEISSLARHYGLVPQIICTGFDEQQPATVSNPRMQIVLEKVEH